MKLKLIGFLFILLDFSKFIFSQYPLRETIKVEKEENNLKREKTKKFLKEINRNYTLWQVGDAIKTEIISEGKENKNEEQKNEDSYPAIYIDIAEKIKNRTLGTFRAKGEGVNIIYPNDKRNKFQIKELNKSLEQNPDLISNNIQYFNENFKDLNISTNFTTFNTDNLLSGDAHKILKIRLDMENDFYNNEINDFSSIIKRKKINKILGSFQKVLNKKHYYPDSDITGEEKGKYDPIKHMYWIYQNKKK